MGDSPPATDALVAMFGAVTPATLAELDRRAAALRDELALLDSVRSAVRTYLGKVDPAGVGLPPSNNAGPGRPRDDEAQAAVVRVLTEKHPVAMNRAEITAATGLNRNQVYRVLSRPDEAIERLPGEVYRVREKVESSR